MRSIQLSSPFTNFYVSIKSAIVLKTDYHSIDSRNIAYINQMAIIIKYFISEVYFSMDSVNKSKFRAG
jgi:hypothetical protein